MTDIQMLLGKVRGWTGAILIGGWAVGLSYLIATLMIGHWVSLPHPEVGEKAPFHASLLMNSDDEDSEPTISVFHFLYGNCPCSQRILKQIVSRAPMTGTPEKIVFIGNDPEFQSEAIELGYSVDCVTPEQLKEKYGVESAPFMMIVDRGAKILYSGGYTPRKQGLNNQDQSIIAAILDGRSVQELPLFGCAVSQELKNIVDPLRLKSINSK